MSGISISPAQREKVLAQIARDLGRDIRAALDLDSLATLELSTAAQLLGISVKQAGRILPVIELGPRTRRVKVSDYKTYLAARTIPPSRPSAS